MTDAADPASIFREEAADLLVQLEEALLGLEAAPADRELVDSAFRALHTIKGSGSMFGFEETARFTHHLETAFDKVRQGELLPSGALIGLALAAKDHIRGLIEAPDQVSAEDGDRLLAEVAALTASAPAGGPATDPAPAANAAPVLWRLRFRLAPEVLLRGTNPLLLLDELRELGACTVTPLTEAVPALEELDPCACHLGWEVLLTTDRPRSAIEEVFIFVLDDMELLLEQVPNDPARLGDILVEHGDVTRPAAEAAASRQEKLGTLLVKDGTLSEDKLSAALAEQKARNPEPEGRGANPQAGSIRVPAERLDNLMDQVGELVIAQARLKQLIGSGDFAQIKSIAEEIERLSSGLRDTTMGIRMVPIGSLFGRFRRLVRDLSQELGKEVQLSMAGEETELDKTVIERLNDPLVHLIRNSLDHGIEDAEARAAASKPRQGHIHLSASHSGAQVLITIRDDGRGLDPARIRAKAEERGIVPPEAKLSESEVLQLIFHPGFSTAKAVTKLSGRGVGMDVVKRTIELLRGSVELTNHAGQGAAVTMRLPLTLAIIDGLLVRVGTGRYVIPLSAVEECVELSCEDDLRHAGRNFLNIRGDLVPYLRLRELFGSRAAADRYQKVVIVSTGDRRIGLVVDQVLGDHQTVIKSLSKLHADIETFSGATILGDGTVALILDVAHLVASGQILEQQRRAS